MTLSGTRLLWIGGTLLALGLLPFVMPYIAIVILCAVYGGMFAVSLIAHGASGFVLLVILFYGADRGGSPRWLMSLVLAVPLAACLVVTSRFGAAIATRPWLLAWADSGWTLLYACFVVCCARVLFDRWGRVLAAANLATTPVLAAASVVTSAWDPAAGLMAGMVVPLATYGICMAIFAMFAMVTARMALDVRRRLDGRAPPIMTRMFGVLLLGAALALQILTNLR